MDSTTNENKESTVISANSIGSPELAYLGDSVIELLVREKLVKSGVIGAGNLNRHALTYVMATAQSDALERILPILTEKESDIFRRARNHHGTSIPKSASAVQYRRATGLEALFGYLWLSGEKERAYELFSLAYPDTEENEV